MASSLKTTIREELISIQKADPGGILYPKRALSWARENKRSALHNALDWNNREAAEKWRLQQIRSLITLHITFADGSPQVISLSIDRTSGGGYRALSDVMQVPDLRKIALADALRELERVQMKYRHIEELAKVWKDIDDMKPPPPGSQPPKRPRGGGKRGGGAGGSLPPRKPRPKSTEIRQPRVG